MELRPKHLRAIELLAGTDLQKQHVAGEIGVAPRTLGRWLKDRAFREELTRQRKVQAFRIDGLRMEATHDALRDVVDRFETGGDKPPIKEITQLLDRLVGGDFARARLGDQADVPEGCDEPVEPEPEPRAMTTEEAEAIWAERARREQQESAEREPAESAMRG